LREWLGALRLVATSAVTVIGRTHKAASIALDPVAGL
jgi:hypothetical protein